MGASYYAYLLDWDDICARFRKLPKKKRRASRSFSFLNTLTDPDSGEFNTDCIQKIPNWWQSDILCPAADIWEAIRGASEVPKQMDEAAQSFMNHTITWKDYWNDLRMDYSFIVCMNPKSAAQCAKAASKVDFRLYKKAYDEKAKLFDKQWLIDALGSKAKPETSFQYCFHPYVKMWTSGFQLAARQKKGFAVEWRD